MSTFKDNLQTSLACAGLNGQTQIVASSGQNELISSRKIGQSQSQNLVGPFRVQEAGSIP